MCLACVGSCPEAAILDNLEAPQVRFIEIEVRAMRHLRGDVPGARDQRSCRGSTSRRRAKAPRVLNEAAIFACIALRQAARHGQDDRRRCWRSSPAHSMFAAPGALDRLKMCADCRVVDLIRNENSVGHPRSSERPGSRARHARATGSSRRTRRAREFYALLARLYAGGARRARCWRRSARSDTVAGRRRQSPCAARGTRWSWRAAPWTPTAAEQEYTDLFVGVGQEPSATCTRRIGSPRSMTERPLVAVRADLARAGTRPPAPARRCYEDHLAALCETMRMLVAGRRRARDRRRSPCSAHSSSATSRRGSFDCCDAILRMSACQLLSPRSRIHQFVHGGRT